MSISKPFIFSLLLCFIPTYIHSFPTTSKLEHRTFIIRVNQHAKPTIFPTHHHWYQSTLNSISSTTKILHTYNTVFNGFSAHLTDSEANLLSKQPHILSLIPEQVRSLHTTRSPFFLGLETSTSSPSNATSLLEESDFGSDLVIGVLDTGIWPEHPSFNDRGLGPVPRKWRGTCPHHFPCNNKIIGAKFFREGYEATNGRMNASEEVRTVRDSDGHGTHTASIAAGRYVFPADTLGYAKGVAAGMAPKARLGVYKVCWKLGCYDSDILKAFDEAVKDGVDVISLSVGGVVVPYYLDSIAIAAFRAVQQGVFVSASAGNGGPAGSSVTNVAPWVTTVGAGSIDRDFPAHVVLGNGRRLPGVSVYKGPRFDAGKYYPVVYAGSTESGGGGESSLDPNLVKGKIVLCDRGINSRVAKGQVVKQAGGIGMILANAVFDGEGLVADCHVLPATSVGSANGDIIRRYIANSLKRSLVPMATIVFQGTRVGVRPAPIVAAFSARGPNPQTPEILKPDDLTTYDYIDFLCNSNYTINNIEIITNKSSNCQGAKRAGHVGNLNYPSLSYLFQQYGQHKMSSHSIRIATNVGDPKSVYKVKILPPTGTHVTVEPDQLKFRRVGQKLNFLVRVKVEAIKLSAGSSVTRSGAIIWSDGKHTVTSPLIVTMQQPL
ncbi:Subtilisin-like protease SBT1.5 [Bienertia sinuspersici]